MNMSVSARLLIFAGARALPLFISMCLCLYKTASRVSESDGLSGMYILLMGSSSFHLTFVVFD